MRESRLRVLGVLLVVLSMTGVVGALPQDTRDGEKPVSRKADDTAKKLPRRALVAHILITHLDAPQALPTANLSKEDARKRAGEAMIAARAPGANFEEIVSEFSDEPTKAESNGVIGMLMRGRVHEDFKALGEALFQLEVGEISDVVESPLGFHVLTRLEIVEYSASHILIQFQGSRNAPPTVSRTSEEAKERVDKVLAALASGGDFEKLAAEYSDDPSGARGGLLGTFLQGELIAPLEKAVAGIAIGETTGPVHTEFGYHVVRREKVERIVASHVLIQYAGSQGAQPNVQRSKQAAQELATKVLAEIRGGLPFAEAAKKYSDGPTSVRGGDLGLFDRTSMVEPFSDVAFAMKIGEISEPVETPFGFHIILRVE